MDFSHIDLSKFKASNHADFQILGKAIQDFTGEKKFPIFLFQSFPYEKIQTAFLLAEKKGIKSTKYIYGIARKLT